MDLEKIYYDQDGNEVDILQLVKRQPEWAANRIQQMEQQLSNCACNRTGGRGDAYAEVSGGEEGINRG